VPNTGLVNTWSQVIDYYSVMELPQRAMFFKLSLLYKTNHHKLLQKNTVLTSKTLVLLPGLEINYVWDLGCASVTSLIFVCYSYEVGQFHMFFECLPADTLVSFLRYEHIWTIFTLLSLLYKEDKETALDLSLCIDINGESMALLIPTLFLQSWNKASQ
jgi:hypothetical protein